METRAERMLIWCVPKNLIRVKGSVQVLGEVERFVLLSYFLSGLLLRMSCSSREIWKKEDYGSIERCKSAAFVLEKKRWQLGYSFSHYSDFYYVYYCKTKVQREELTFDSLLKFNLLYMGAQIANTVLTFDTHYPHVWAMSILWVSAKKQIGKHFFYMKNHRPNNVGGWQQQIELFFPHLKNKTDNNGKLCLSDLMHLIES